LGEESDVEAREVIALKVNDMDNVATIFSNDAQAGFEVSVRDKKGNVQVVELLNPIPYGHKLAVNTISKGTAIVKYGEEIGVATQDITPGEHVHVHNLDSQRGRGDWHKAERGN